VPLELDQIWEKALPQLERRIGSQPFDIWIKPLILLSIQNGSVIFEVPNVYYSDWIRDNYNQDILKILQDLCAAEKKSFESFERLSFRVAGQNTAPKKSNNGTPPLPPRDPRTPAQSPLRSRQLNPQKNFDSFVVGACNQFAHAASLAVSEFPGQNYNPLFLYGCTGLGKTHLTQAIANQILKREASTRVLYTTAESFVNEMINAIRFKKMDEFRARYRSQVDVLLIDDIQFLSGKDRSQEEFFHTFQDLQTSGRQIVITADVLPREIDKLEPRLRTRFEGGLLADIQPPDLETMLAILLQKCDECAISLSEDLQIWIASRVRGNIRELEGALNRLAALSSFFSAPLDVDFAQKHLGNLYSEEVESITPDKVMQAVARLYAIRVVDLKGTRKIKGIAFPRQIAMFLSRKHTRLSFPDLGRSFNRDNSTVQYACKKIRQQIDKDPDLRHTLNTLERNIGISN
jgi:chromosomal replication initiator protein